MRRLTRTCVALAVIGSLGLAACGSDDDDNSSGSGVVTTTPDSDDTTATTPGSGSAPTTEPGEKPVSGGTFNATHLGAAPTSFDPALNSTGATSRNSPAKYFSAVYGYLLYEDYQSNKVVPQMAESMTATDASNWVLKLRPNVKFSDGTAYDAEAVKFNWERIAAEPKSAQAPIMKTIKTMTVADPLTLNIELVAPNSAFDRTIASNIPWIGSPTALKADPASFATKPVGAGPFTLESYSADFTATYKRNPTYWDAPKPYLDGLVIKLVLDPSQRYNALVSGDSDIADDLPGQILEQAKSAGYEPQTHAAPGGGRTFLLNTKIAPFDDIIARQAFQYAFDADGYNQAVYGGAAIAPLQTLFDKSSPFYDAKAQQPQPDPVKAQQLFDQYAAKTGGPMKITYLGATSPQTAATIDFLSASLQAYKNVEFSAEQVAANDFSAKAISGGSAMVQYVWEAADPGQVFKDLYGTTGGRNLVKYSNPDLDALLAKADATTDPDERVKVLAQAQELLVTKEAVVFLAARYPNYVVLAKRAHGFDTFANTGLWMWDQVWVDG